MRPIIKIENLSKMYRLGTIGTGTISHDLNRWWHRVRGKDDPYLKIGEANVSGDKSTSGYVWALKDINLEVMPGEVLGIIGKNGAGKSTLLKILSRVTGPTTGRISYTGRIGSLLEVGTGFHPELTGRENIFLNGAILGMTKAEISRKLDEIVDFAGVERYIDTPVKRYSSGMRVRLGFAIAAFLEPDILVVDEVLAVGDAEFQKKAIGKMQDVSHQEGRTILFVSHNMASVKNLCNRGILMDNGKISLDSDMQNVIENYILKNNNGKLTDNLAHIQERSGSQRVSFKRITATKNDVDRNGMLFFSGEEITIKIQLENNSKEPVKNLFVGLGIDSLEGLRLLHITSRNLNKYFEVNPEESKEVLFHIKSFNLSSGLYNLILHLQSKQSVEDNIKDQVQVSVESSDFYKSGKLVNEGKGLFLLDYNCIA